MLQHKQDEIDTRMVYVEVTADDADVRGGEPVIAGENVIGVTTSGAYGHTVDKSLAFAYVEPGFAAPESTFDIEILGKRCQAKVLAKPVYDPENVRLRS
jgi:dimethylglycine dehydrogenase